MPIVLRIISGRRVIGAVNTRSPYSFRLVVKLSYCTRSPFGSSLNFCRSRLPYRMSLYIRKNSATINCPIVTIECHAIVNQYRLGCFSRSMKRSVLWIPVTAIPSHSSPIRTSTKIIEMAVARVMLIHHSQRAGGGSAPAARTTSLCRSLASLRHPCQLGFERLRFRQLPRQRSFLRLCLFRH